MTINKRKKVVKYRGSKTHGGGSMKKRRGAGHRGGKGAAGSGKRADQKKPSIWKGKYFGKHGFKSKRSKSIIAININYIEKNLEKFCSQKLINKENDFFSVDLRKIGFNKLLSTGKVTNKYKIKVSYASKKAVEKIKGNGGEVSLIIKEKKE
jgi:large subunit ribosomal protein L15